MKPIYELVAVSELNEGDFVTLDIKGKANTVEIKKIEPSGDGQFTFRYGDYFLGHVFTANGNDSSFRRIPDVEDPRVLRQIIDLMMKHMDECNIENVSFDDWKIEAIRTLEFHFERRGFINYTGTQPVFRRIPSTEDPRVLRRALENAVVAADWDEMNLQQDIDRFIRSAQLELESEAGE